MLLAQRLRRFFGAAALVSICCFVYRWLCFARVAAMLKVGLTGGIGSGKSTVAAQLVELLGDDVALIDADQIARDVVTPAMPELVRAFGQGILQENGSLNRGELAARAFVDREHTDMLNAIMHPKINELTERRFQHAAAEGKLIVLYDNPLLVDMGKHEDVDVVIVVDVDSQERVRRLVAHRGLDPDDARRRIAQQIDDDTRRAAADLIIDNNGGLEQLEPQVARIVKQLRQLAHTTPAAN